MYLEDLPLLVPTESNLQKAPWVHKKGFPLLLILSPVLLGPPLVSIEKGSQVRREWEDAGELNWEVGPVPRATLHSSSLLSLLPVVISLHVGSQ